MTMHQIFLQGGRLAVLLTALLLLPAAGAAAAGAVAPPGPQPPAWRELTFIGSKFTATVNVRLRTEAPPVAATAVSDRPDGCPQAADASAQLIATIVSRSLGGGRSYEERVWFSPGTGAAQARLRLGRDRDPWRKSYCWQADGVRRFTVEPAGAAERAQEPAAWSDRDEAFYTFADERPDGAAVSDPALLLALLPRALAEANDQPCTLWVFGRRHLHRVTVRAAGTEPLEVDYRRRSGELETPVRARIEAVVCAVTTTPLPAAGQSPEPFSLLGLQRDIRLFLDPDSLLPLRVSGTAGLVGTIELDLQQAVVD